MLARAFRNLLKSNNIGTSRIFPSLNLPMRTYSNSSINSGLAKKPLVGINTDLLWKAQLMQELVQFFSRINKKLQEEVILTSSYLAA